MKQNYSHAEIHLHTAWCLEHHTLNTLHNKMHYTFLVSNVKQAQCLIWYTNIIPTHEYNAAAHYILIIKQLHAGSIKWNYTHAKKIAYNYATQLLDNYHHWLICGCNA